MPSLQLDLSQAHQQPGREIGKQGQQPRRHSARDGRLLCCHGGSEEKAATRGPRQSCPARGADRGGDTGEPATWRPGGVGPGSGGEWLPGNRLSGAIFCGYPAADTRAGAGPYAPSFTRDGPPSAGGRSGHTVGATPRLFGWDRGEGAQESRQLCGLLRSRCTGQGRR